MRQKICITNLIHLIKSQSIFLNISLIEFTFGKISLTIFYRKRLIALFNGVEQPLDRQVFYEVLFSEMPLGTQLEANLVSSFFVKLII